MSKWIKPARLRSSVFALSYWGQCVRTQNAQHLFPLLALLEAGVNSNSFTTFEESHDFEFWNRYARIPGDTRPAKAEDGTYHADFYIDPLTRVFRDADHPHRSPSTFRKRTFSKSWEAAEFQDVGGHTNWKLSPSFAAIFESKVLTKAKQKARIPVIDLSVFLFKAKAFSDDADAKALVQMFRDKFPFQEDDYNRLFEFADETASELFTSEEPSQIEYEKALRDSLREDQATPDAPSDVESPPDCQDDNLLDEDDPVLLDCLELLALGSSGIILRGCPGTGKTWYANRIAERLVANPEIHIVRVQFHPSYGYEDFVEGYVPSCDSVSGFEIIPKVFVEACRMAHSVSEEDERVVLIIDEINRGDPGRIFGEILTYIENGYRGIEFLLPYSRKKLAVPRNLILLGTMNHFDKSISQLDQAFLRRFDHVDLRPSSDVLTRFLELAKGFDNSRIQLVADWFENLQKMVEAGVGHTYFKEVKRLESLQIIWNFRIRPYCAAALELEPAVMSRLDDMFQALIQRIMSEDQRDDIDTE